MRATGAATLTASPVITETASATPTATLTPALVTITLSMPAEHFTEGDNCWLKLLASNPGSEREADLYVLLDVAGDYWCYPGWQPLAAGLVHETVTVGQGTGEWTLIEEFTMPAVSPYGPLFFYAAMFEVDTLSLETLVSNGAMCEFYLGD